MPPTARTYAWCAAGLTIFAVAGSLAPFNFEPQSISTMIARLRATPYLHPGVDSRSDYLANILLFVPLAFCWTGALRVDRRDRFGAALAAVAVLLSGVLVSAAIELAQIVFPPRTASVNDVVAETVGTLIGFVGWCLVGEALTAWLRERTAERERPATLVRMLLAYAAVFAVLQLLPLDIIFRPSELARKLTEGRVLLRPFSVAHESARAAWWDYAGHALSNAPLGALAMLPWTRRGHRRSVAAAFVLGATAVAVIELGRLFIVTRVADVTHVITGTVGVAIGAVVTARSSGRTTERHPRARPAPGAWRAAAAAAAWSVAVTMAHWFPFDFNFSRALIRQHLERFAIVPFRTYSFGAGVHPFVETSRAFMLAVVLGILVERAWPLGTQRLVARLQAAVILLAAAALFVGIEVGKIFLETGAPDLTDAVVAELGLVAGLTIVRWFVRTTDPVGARPPIR